MQLINKVTLLSALAFSSLFLNAPENSVLTKQGNSLNGRGLALVDDKYIEQVMAKEVAQLMKDTRFSAISCGIYINGKKYQFHFGKLTNGKKPTDQTLYEIGSITKTYTGLLLSQAIYDRKLELNKDIRFYLGDKYPNLVLEKNNPITLKHLVTHSSGMPMNINCNNKLTVQGQLTCLEAFAKPDFFKQLKEVKLEDKTGKNYHYSNAGMQLVGYLIEDAYHMSYDALLKKYIFARSGESDTHFGTTKGLENRLALGRDSNGIIMPIEHGGYGYAGGLKSSTRSMLNFIKMYAESSDPVIRQSLSLLAGNEQYGRAYAWNTYNYKSSNKMVYHNGGTFGTSSWIALYPEQKTGIFLVTNLMTNDSQRQLNELSNNIMAQIFKKQ